MANSEFWRWVSTFAAALDRASYYDVLGLDRRVDATGVNTAFRRLSTKLDPMPHRGSVAVAQLIELNAIYARVREAHQVLSNPQLRTTYDAGLAQGRIRYGSEPTIGVPRQATPPPRAATQPLAPATPKGAAPPSSSQRTPPPRRPGARRLQTEPGIGQVSPQPAAPTRPAQIKPSGPSPTPSGAPPRRPKARSAVRAFADLVAKGPIADAIGIDFGTSYTSISVGVGSQVYAVPDSYGRTLHPSIVHYRGRREPQCGWNARDMLIAAPRSTVSSPKRLMGRSHSDPALAGLLQSASYKTAPGPNDTILVQVDGDEFALAQVCSAIVKHAVGLAERQLKRKIKRAVMSVPVTYRDAERSAMRRVAQLAGLELLEFIDEPHAAAMAYGFGQNKQEIVAVYDFGGGTFDFTVIEVSGYSFRMLTRGGDAWLGGDDFDLALATAFANAIWRKTKTEVRSLAVEWQRLLMACETTKRQLTTLNTTPIIVDRLIERPAVFNLHQQVTRATFEKLCSDLVRRSLGICHKALEKVGLEPSDVGQVVMSGGVSKIPFVRSSVSAFFNRPLEQLVNPDEAISLGAGLRAAQLSRFPTYGVGRLE